nr:MAG TPA: hypothetical protein [Caudoviricetes sp.]
MTPLLAKSGNPNGHRPGKLFYSFKTHISSYKENTNGN